MSTADVKKVPAQRPAMGCELFDVKNSKAMLVGKPLNGEEGKIREMLVIDGVKLILLDQPLEVRKFKSDQSHWRQQVRHARGEVMEIRNLCQHIVTNDEIGSPSFGDKTPGELKSKELDECRNILKTGSFSHIGRGLDA